MKRILIISEYFYPDSNIGARRPTKIAKKLHSLGYKVDVFTRYSIENTDGLCDNVFSIETRKEGQPDIYSQPPRKRSEFYTALYHVFSPIRVIRGAYRVLKEFKRLLSEDERLKNTEYDAVFSTFGPLSSLFCGLYYKRKHRSTKWICDFRDPVVVKYIHKLWIPVFRMIEKRACRRADAIVAVSNGYLERICRGKHKEKAVMIPNGYDVDDMVFASDVSEPDEYIKITYVGALYGGDRDLSPLFKALSELLADGKIQKEKLRVAYAGKEYEVIRQQADKYAMGDITEDNGMLSSADCLRLQFSSHLLLLSTWNEKKEYGVFPGKLLEYMLIGKPIISITNGDMPNGEVSAVIREGNFGVAYETVCDSVDFENLKKYIEKVYNEWLLSQKINFEPKKDVLERYNYKTVIQQVEDLING